MLLLCDFLPMNISNLPRAPRLWCLLALGLVPPAAQASQADRQLEKPSGRDVTILVRAKESAVAGQVAAAETLLMDEFRGARHTFEWYHYGARALTRLTIGLGADGKNEAQRATARRALEYLSAAERMTPHASVRANLQLTAGMIQERYLDDLSAAKGSYRQAMNAGNVRAASALSRLDRSEEKTAGRKGHKRAGG